MRFMGLDVESVRRIEEFPTKSMKCLTILGKSPTNCKASNEIREVSNKLLKVSNRFIEVSNHSRKVSNES